MLRILFLLLLFGTLTFISCNKESKEQREPNKILTDEELHAKADSLAKNIIIVDTHIDLPYRLGEKYEDISNRTLNGDFDFPRAKRGGLNAAFMSIYISPKYEGTGQAKTTADNFISMIENISKKHPDKFALAYSVADVTNQFKTGIISFAFGMENGSPIEGKLENLEYFYKKGIRYITLAHRRNNHISDSSFERNRKWNGLSPFGEEVVKEMNRLGIMVDVSHISDSAFYDVINLSKTPVIASHSSCRYFTPGWERNMSDEMIKALAKNGGVIQINFGSSFLDDELRKKEEKNEEYIANYIKENNFTDAESHEVEATFLKENHPGYASVKDVVTHINHVVKLVGIDHVGLGSDFEGLGDTLPVGLKDVSQYPNLIYELLKEGYSDNDIIKICSGNIIRVWSAVEEYAKNSSHK
ncbi:MAG TPA: dipeptidase [Ignavibacteriaceae bacterium]|nr:dipeptidase [Ignavibacteriaceae bacterium]